VHVESVAWVAERKDVLSAFFGLLALICYLSYLKRRGALRYLAVCLCFALALMAKPMLVTLPLVMLLLDYWPLARLDAGAPDGSGTKGSDFGKLAISRLVLEKLPLLALSLASSLITMYVQSRGEAVHTLELTPLSFRLENAVVAYLRYLGKLVWPADLAVLYPLPKSIPLLESGASLLVLLLVSAAVLAQARRRPYLPVGWFWFLGTLVPVIGLVQVGLQSMADRYLYLPM